MSTILNILHIICYNMVYGVGPKLYSIHRVYTVGIPNSRLQLPPLAGNSQ